MRLPLLAATLALSLTAPAQHPLTALRDHNRVLVVFAPDSKDDRLRKQLAGLDEGSMKERDLILIPVLAHWQESDRDLRSAHTPYTDAPDQQYIYRQLHIDSADFTVILIGKDGGEKLRSRTPVSMEQLNQLIDSMPMRQQERKTRPQP